MSRKRRRAELMPNTTVLPFPVRAALDRAATEAGRSLIDSLVTDYHTGRKLVDDETACLWTTADLLEDSCDWTDQQRRAVAATLQREVMERVGRAAR
jgi:hypothetical protein